MRGKINKRTADSLKPGAKDQFLWDSDVRGFGLKVTPQGRRVYVVQYRLGSKIGRYTIGVHGSPWTPDEARKEAIRVLGEVTQGINPNVAKKAARRAKTVSELCDLYLREGVATKKASTLATDKGRIERHIKPLLGRRKIGEVTRADVVRFQNDIAEGKTAASVKTDKKHGRAIVRGGKGTAARTVGLLGGIFSFAVEQGLRSDNPVRDVKRFRDTRRDKFPSSAELARLGDALAEAEGKEMPGTITAIRLVALTGARRGEIVTAKWDYVDWERGLLVLPNSKTGQKVIVLGAAALEALRTAPRVDGNPFICPGEKDGAPIGGIQKSWQRIRKRANLGDMRLHDLRHGFASISASAGDSLLVVGKMLGHRDAKSTQRYAHLADDPVKAAADRTSRDIDATMRRKKGGDVVQMARQK